MIRLTPPTKVKEPPTKSNSELSVENLPKGKGITGGGKWDGKRFVLGKIITQHPHTGEPLVVLIHRSNQDDIIEFKFVENGAMVEFDWAVYKGKYTAKNVRYRSNSDPRYKIIISKLKKAPKRHIMSVEKFLAYIYTKHEHRNLRRSDGSKITIPDQSQWMIDSACKRLGITILGCSDSLVHYVKDS